MTDVLLPGEEPDEMAVLLLGEEPDEPSAVAPEALERDHSQWRYTQDRRGIRALLGLAFSPLPFRPRAEPWTREQLEERVSQQMCAETLSDLLAEAESINASRRERAASAESRATTLQGAAGVAMGLVLAGAGFMLDPDKVADRTWRVLLAVTLAALLLCLGMSGLLATRATLRFFTWARPGRRRAVLRASKEFAAARRHRALDLLIYANHNSYVAAFKLAQVRVAGQWFRCALTCLGLLILMVTVYVIAGPTPR